MKKQLITLVALVTIPAFSFAQTAQEVIDKNIAAIGGADKVAAVKSLQYDQAMNIMGMDLTGKATIVVGKSLRNDITVMGQQMTTVVDGDKGWTVNPMQGGTAPQALPDDQVKMQKGNTHLMGADLAVAKANNYPVTLVGKEKMDGKDVYNLKVTRPEGDANYFVDASTNQLSGMKTTVTAQGQTGEINLKYGDYKTVDGLALPTTMNIESPAMPAPMKMTVSNIVINPTIDNAIFMMPK